MKIPQYTFQRFGFTLQDVWVEIEEVTSRQNVSFFDDSDQVIPQKDGLARIRIWASEDSRLAGSEPLETIQRVVLLENESKQAWHRGVLAQAFNQSVIQIEE